MRERIRGTSYVVAAYTTWGLLPLYWKALKSVPSQEILGHRILWSFVFLALLLSFQKRWPEFQKTFTLRRNLITFFTTAVIIGSNWLIYIWSINTNHIVDASMGYFINPLVSVLLGLLFLRERLNFWQIISLILASIGVFYMVFQNGKIPWIALSLALTFGFYALLRKKAQVESLAGLSAETAILSPVVIIFLGIQAIKGNSAFGTAPLSIHLFLFGAGVVTAIPLLWFNYGVRKIPLSTVGFLQYLSPSLQFLLGVLVFKEPFTNVYQISFAFIWVSLLIYSLSKTSFLLNLLPKFFSRKHPLYKNQL